MRFTKAAALSLFVLSVGTGAHVAQAGFGFSDTGAATQAVVDAPVASSEPVAPALQVFNERYVPDQVSKKYQLKDTWYDAPPASAPLPVKEIPASEAPMSLQPADMSPPSAVQSAPEVVVDSWRARKGETLRDVLQRWSVRGGTNLMWASPDAPALQKDFSFVGKYQDAVNALIKETGGDKIHSQYRSEGLNPIMMTPAATVTTNAPPPLPSNIAVVPKDNGNIFSKAFQPETKEELKPETRWFGLSGAPLAEVIQVWADDAGVKLVWQSEKNFALKESVTRVGHFEDAVFQALSQYDDEPVRPVGEIYQDPKTGQQILLVRTDVKS